MLYFHNIMGNTFLINNLRKLVKNNTFSHSYLISGNEGVGRKTITNTLVKYMLCDNRESLNLDEPCGECKSCITFENGNHTDVTYIGEKNSNFEYDNDEENRKLEINSEKNQKTKKTKKTTKTTTTKTKTKTKSIGVDEVRDNILNTINHSPFYSFKKVYIINNGDDLTAEAQNMLLKTLEEPPKYVVFFIIANKKENLLKTVLSRVVEINIPPISEQLVKEYVLKYKNNLNDFGNIEEKNIEKIEKIEKIDEEFISVYAQGSIGRAIYLMDNKEFYEARENIISDLCELHFMPFSRAFLLAEKWDSKYKNEKHFFNILEIWYRDLFVLLTTNDEKYIVQKDKKNELYKIINSDVKCDFSMVYQYILDAKKSMVYNGNFRLTLETMLIYIKENEKYD